MGYLDNMDYDFICETKGQTRDIFRFMIVLMNLIPQVSQDVELNLRINPLTNLRPNLNP